MARSAKQRARATAWSHFSKYIRVRDALLTYGSATHCFCVTCGALKEIKKIHAAHFISREHEATMFDERNVHGCCYVCNVMKQGRWPEYFEFMEKTYGIETIRSLMEQRLIKIDLTEEDFRLIADKYRMLYKEICNG